MEPGCNCNEQDLGINIVAAKAELAASLLSLTLNFGKAVKLLEETSK